MRYVHFDLPLGVTLKWALGTIAVLCMIAYGIFEGRYLIKGPTLSLQGEPPRATREGAVEIRGRAENIATLYLNGRKIYTTDNGSFIETVTLQNGYTTMTLEAVDRYGNRETLERGVVKQQTEDGPNLSVSDKNRDIW